MTEEELEARITELENERDQMRTERDNLTAELARVRAHGIGGEELAARLSEAHEARIKAREATASAPIRGLEDYDPEQSTAIRGLN